jgi:uncharacterized RDD family membrane protein YckC
VILLVMPNTFSQTATTVDIDNAWLWQHSLWFAQRTARLNWRDVGSSPTALSLVHVRPSTSTVPSRARAETACQRTLRGPSRTAGVPPPSCSAPRPLWSRSREGRHTIGEDHRPFATLWQRALAQLVDVVPLAAGFLVPMAWMWRAFSDPEMFLDRGPLFPLSLFALFLAAFVWMLLVLAIYSYFEGRFGKTPGKWILGIRVLGTDLRPCGFGRAVLRNLLTFVDGFFNFLVGALLVALTENWQRLGDLAARTVVVADHEQA